MPQDWLEILVQGKENKSFSCNLLLPSMLVLEFDVLASAVGCFLTDRCVIWEGTLLQLDWLMGILTKADVPLYYWWVEWLRGVQVMQGVD